MEQGTLLVGCAGWSINSQVKNRFPSEGTHLSRYADVLPIVEINSCFYRHHKPETYAKWSESTPDHFQFSLKLPKSITHTARLKGDYKDILQRFLTETSYLGRKRGPILIQLPPSLPFNRTDVEAFSEYLRQCYDGVLVIEPRHPSWDSDVARELYQIFNIEQIAADPAPFPAAGRPCGRQKLIYYRWHGSPEMYKSKYTSEQILELGGKLAQYSPTQEIWCIFDNTNLGHAIPNALELKSTFTNLTSLKKN